MSESGSPVKKARKPRKDKKYFTKEEKKEAHRLNAKKCRLKQKMEKDKMKISSNERDASQVPPDSTATNQLVFCKPTSPICPIFEKMKKFTIPINTPLIEEKGFHGAMEDIVIQLGTDSSQNVLFGRILHEYESEESVEVRKTLVQPGFGTISEPLSTEYVNFMTVDWLECASPDGLIILRETELQYLHGNGKCLSLAYSYF